MLTDLCPYGKNDCITDMVAREQWLAGKFDSQTSRISIAANPNVQ